MRQERIPIAREGYPFIGAAAWATLVGAVLGYQLVALVLFFLTLFILNFFRDPERVTPAEEEAIIAPADGKVIVVEQVNDERFSADRLWKISIFMNVFNVHVNRIPCAGVVKEIAYVPGRFLAADHRQAHLLNEYCATTIRTDRDEEVTVVQVAGLIARRIVCRIETGDRVRPGQRYGMIRFGSRLDIYLPLSANIVTTVGQKTRCGETVIARWPS
jgi:phosphatidylserine decarboxylase